MQSSGQIVTTNKTTPSFLQTGYPSCRPTNSVKALKGKISHSTDLSPQAHLKIFQPGLCPLKAPVYLGERIAKPLVSPLTPVLTVWYQEQCVFHIKQQFGHMIPCNSSVLLDAEGGYWPRTTRSWRKVPNLPFRASSTSWWSWRSAAIMVSSSDLRKPARRRTKVDLR